MAFLDDLTEFNPALIYGFDPESSCHPIRQDDPRYPIHFSSQYDDVYRAYLYAQNEILPAIKGVGKEKITSQQLLRWLNEIHGRIAATLAKDYQNSGYPNINAGRYISPGHEIIRWWPGTDIENMICYCLSFDPVETERVALYASMAKKVANDYKVNADELAAFLTLVEEKYPMHCELSHGKPDLRFGQQRIALLCKDWMDGKLKDKEIAVLRKIMTIGMRAEKMVPSMEAYATRTLKALVECDKNDIDQVSKFLSRAFYELTEIHPYFNGNGRTATCWVNILLRLLDFPSILIRTPNERDDESSSYSLAMKDLIDGKHERLANHIKKRVLEAMNGNKFSDEELKKLVSLRVETKNLLIQIGQEFSSFDLKEFFKGPLREIFKKLEKDSEANPNAKSKYASDINAMSHCTRLLIEKQKELKFSTMKGAMKQAIATLSEKEEWKLSEKDGVKIWHAFPESEAESVRKALSVYTCFTVQKRKVTGDQVNCVVIVSDIQIDSLMACEKKKSEEAGEKHIKLAFT